MRARYAFIVALLLTSCPSESAIVAVELSEREPESLVLASQAMPARRHTLVRAEAVGPYESWPLWCEGPATPCQTDAQCPSDRTGRTRKCIRPWWSKQEKVCAIPFMGRDEHRAHEAQLRRIVDAQCGKGCVESKLFSFVLLIARRESSLRHWKQHRLNPDIAAARTSWARSKKTYLEAGNPHIQQKSRWLGWGLLGQQSPTFTMLWDVSGAPPEILCRPAVAVATYLSCARRSWVKQNSLGIVPTWDTVHAACSLGQVRPKKRNENFRARARRLGLDPDERISKAQLGMVVGASPQARNAWLALVEAGED